jgi:HEAT repeat protein
LYPLQRKGRNAWFFLAAGRLQKKRPQVRTAEGRMPYWNRVVLGYVATILSPRAPARVANEEPCLAGILTNDEVDPIVRQCISNLGEADPRKRVYALTVLGTLGSVARQALPALLHVLKDGLAPLRGLALQVLCEVAPEPSVLLPCLLKALQDGDNLVRRRAVILLGDMGSEARLASAALVQALRDPCPAVRRHAAAALGEIGPLASTAAPALIEALREDDVRYRAVILAALVKLGPRAIPRLLDALHHANPSVRRYAARALSKCPTRHHLDDALAILRDDPDPMVRAELHQVLRQPPA